MADPIHATHQGVTLPAIPVPTADIQSIQQAVMAIKQNIETTQGTTGIVRASQIHPLTTVNIQIAAAIKQAKP